MRAMEWLENIPATARLALSVGGATVAARADLLPPAFQAMALGAGIALCCYGLAASMQPFFNRRDTDWLEAERSKDFARQQTRLAETFRKLKSQ